jgi:hypothetical protein
MNRTARANAAAKNAHRLALLAGPHRRIVVPGDCSVITRTCDLEAFPSEQKGSLDALAGEAGADALPAVPGMGP